MNTCANCNRRIASGLSPALCGGCREKITTLLKVLSPAKIAGTDERLMKEAAALEALAKGER
jgi:hypothetical protein